MNPLDSTNPMRLGTGLRPGSQMRPGSNRMQAVGMGGSIQQSVSVSAQAAVTREGMRAASRSGLQSSAGPGRQVGDRSYYVGILRQKNAELLAEIEKLTKEAESIEREGSVLAQLQQKNRSLQGQLNELKSSLADVNLALEKSTSQDAAAVREEAKELNKRNTEQKKQVDELFLKAKESESKYQANTASLEEEMQGIEERILRENQDFGHYKAVRDEAYNISDMVLERMHEFRMLNAKQELLMKKLATDTDKRKAVGLLREILNKKKERDELTRQCSLSLEEEKQMIIKEVKNARADIEVLQRQSDDTKENIREAKIRVTALDDEIKSFSGDNLKAYQELLEKDKEIDNFMQSFPDREKEELRKIDDSQRAIARLGERISQALELRKQMPKEGSPNALQSLATEVDAKRDQLEKDQMTHQRLQKELLDRKAELDKVASLDQKIKAELESHAAKMAQQNQEIETYSNLTAMRENVDVLRKDLNEQKVYLKRLAAGTEKQLKLTASEYEAAKKKLNENSYHIAMQQQEQKLRLLWQSTYGLEDFVRLREKDSHYLPIKAECLRMVDDCNLILKNPARYEPVGSPMIMSPDRM